MLFNGSWNVSLSQRMNKMNHEEDSRKGVGRQSLFNVVRGHYKLMFMLFFLLFSSKLYSYGGLGLYRTLQCKFPVQFLC